MEFEVSSHRDKRWKIAELQEGQQENTYEDQTHMHIPSRI